MNVFFILYLYSMKTICQFLFILLCASLFSCAGHKKTYVVKPTHDYNERYSKSVVQYRKEHKQSDARYAQKRQKEEAEYLNKENHKIPEPMKKKDDPNQGKTPY